MVVLYVDFFSDSILGCLNSLCIALNSSQTQRTRCRSPYSSIVLCLQSRRGTDHRRYRAFVSLEARSRIQMRGSRKEHRPFDSLLSLIFDELLQQRNAVQKIRFGQPVDKIVQKCVVSRRNQGVFESYRGSSS